MTQHKGVKEDKREEMNAQMIYTSPPGPYLVLCPLRLGFQTQTLTKSYLSNQLVPSYPQAKYTAHM